MYDSFFFSLPNNNWPTVGIYEWINGKICPSMHEGLSYCHGLNIYFNSTYAMYDCIIIAKHSNNTDKITIPFAYLQSQSPPHLHTYTMNV